MAGSHSARRLVLVGLAVVALVLLLLAPMLRTTWLLWISWKGAIPQTLVIEKLGGAEAASHRLHSYLSYPDVVAPQKQWAISVLSACGEPALPVLVEATRHRDHEVRAKAAYTLGKFGLRDEVVSALGAALEDTKGSRMAHRQAPRRTLRAAPQARPGAW